MTVDAISQLMPPLLPTGIPIAHVFGKPVLDVPRGLFIPPDALRVMLESFEGPLDLLLYLIRQQQLNILDIPIATVTAQYLDYIRILEATRLELAADYLLMAAVLIEIKSKLLLPCLPVGEEDDELEDPRAELVQRLLDYQQIKLAGLKLDTLPRVERDFVWLAIDVDSVGVKPQPTLNVTDISGAWLTIFSRFRQCQEHRVEKHPWSVREQMAWIVDYLADRSYVSLNHLFDKDTLDMTLFVINFIAVLELVKEGLVCVSQGEPYQAVYLRLALT